jgi:transcriptional regulator with XRE-family HTH domain
MPWRNSAGRESASFAELLDLVREEVRTRVRNGQTTERGLAMRVGISQPYLHNVLKGARQMTPDLADRLMLDLNLTVTDLFVQWIGPNAYGRDDRASR